MKESLPPEFLNSLEGIEGFERKKFEAIHESDQQITSIRFKREKQERYNSLSNNYHPSFNLQKQVPWCKDGFYLDERPSFTLDPLLHAGAYYVQEASSMFLWEVLKQVAAETTNLKVLDLCAAPGGKTTLLASYFKDGLIVSNEVIKSRVNVLYENVTKWGAENIVITNNEATDFQRLENYFDIIIADAPCSGSGLFRKDNNAINEWSINNVKLCSQRQQRVLAAVYPALKNNGILIYSTCSYSKEENEDVTDLIKNDFAFDSIQLKLKNEWNITETQSSKHKAYCYRFWPDKIQGEGFFIIALRKVNNEDNNIRYDKHVLTKAGNKERAITENYLEENDWLLFRHKENIHVINKHWSTDIGFLQKKTYLRKAGIQAGSVKGNDLVPHHELALSTITNKNLQKFECSIEQALQYLRKKDINASSEYKSWALPTFKNYPLGWIKILHNRVNNYYPTVWRILKD